MRILLRLGPFWRRRMAIRADLLTIVTAETFLPNCVVIGRWIERSNTRLEGRQLGVRFEPVFYLTRPPASAVGRSATTPHIRWCSVTRDEFSCNRLRDRANEGYKKNRRCRPQGISDRRADLAQRTFGKIVLLLIRIARLRRECWLVRHARCRNSGHGKFRDVYMCLGNIPLKHKSKTANKRENGASRL